MSDRVNNTEQVLSAMIELAYVKLPFLAFLAFQGPPRLLVLEGEAHPPNEEHAGKCQRAKQEEIHHSSRVVNVESKAWR